MKKTKETPITREKLIDFGFEYRSFDLYVNKETKHIYVLEVKKSFDGYPMYLYFGFDEDGVLLSKLLWVEDYSNVYDYDFTLNIDTMEEIKALITLLR